jgi:hypothetical protein
MFGAAFAFQGRPLTFLFFSNRLGCFGSLLLSLLITAVLLLVFAR